MNKQYKIGDLFQKQWYDDNTKLDGIVSGMIIEASNEAEHYTIEWYYKEGIVKLRYDNSVIDYHVSLNNVWKNNWKHITQDWKHIAQ